MYCRHVVVFLLLVQHASVGGCDPLNVLSNGDFEHINGISLTTTLPSITLSASSPISIAALPAWRVAHGALQILSNLVFFSPNPASSFSAHLNSPLGPATLRSFPFLSPPRPAASYNVSWIVAAHPLASYPSTTLNVSLYVDDLPFSTFSSPPLFVSPNSTPSFLNWSLLHFSFLGTGRFSFLEFVSCTPGHYGLLIDDVQIALSNLIYNGGFQSTRLASGDDEFVVLQAPSDSISGWFVSSGNVKCYTTTSLDSSSSGVVDLNGDVAGAITTSFFTVKSLTYSIIFDFAANPQAPTPLSGTFFATVICNDDATVTANQAMIISAPTNISTIQWQTGAITFVATGSSTNVTFISQITGHFGPLLDNVQAYEVDANSTRAESSNSGPSGRLSSSLWTEIWLAVLMGVMLQR